MSKHLLTLNLGAHKIPIRIVRKVSVCAWSGIPEHLPLALVLCRGSEVACSRRWIAMFAFLIFGWFGRQEIASAQSTSLVPSVSQAALVPFSFGVTWSGNPLQAWIGAEDLDLHSSKVRLLVVAGLDGSEATTRAAESISQFFNALPLDSSVRANMALSLVPRGNPDRFPAPVDELNVAGKNASIGYPPKGEYYTSSTNPEAQYLWRWIGMHAPDRVIVLVHNEREGWISNEELREDSLSRQLSTTAACGVGRIESITMGVNASSDLARVTQQVFQKMQSWVELPRDQAISEARRELQRRNARSPLDTARQLAKVYGHELPSVAYIPAVACWGRIRLALLEKSEDPIRDVERIAEPYLGGSKSSLTEKSTSSDVAGHILWGALFDATRKREYIPLVLKAADRGFDSQGRGLESMPGHNELSDSVFMGCPILAQAGRLTGKSEYFDMCLTHMRFMRKLNVRTDGLHRHSPLDESAWGRGNGFPALGLALALSDLPEDHPGRAEMLKAFHEHLAALLPHQDRTGAWHQVIDHPESYREFTATCMITFALARGVHRGWLDRSQFGSAIDNGWRAIQQRIAEDGTLVDVCTGTGKMKTLRDYLDRPAILGRDPRGGAMALLVATEIAEIESSVRSK